MLNRDFTKSLFHLLHAGLNFSVTIFIDAERMI